MPKAILGRKLGMTRYYDGEGRNIPVTVIEAGPCYVSQLKNQSNDGYSAVQLAYEDLKARHSSYPEIGHDAKAGLGPKRYHREVRLDESELAEYELGQSITAEQFEGIAYVDVTGTSKGKGYAGVMKKYGFRGQPKTHGTERKHRSPGSIGGRASNRGTGKPKKGIRMSGRMGVDRVTVRSLPLISIDKQKNLILVKGPIPGPSKGLVMIREAKRLYKGKSQLAKAS